MSGSLNVFWAFFAAIMRSVTYGGFVLLTSVAILQVGGSFITDYIIYECLVLLFGRSALLRLQQH